MSRPERALCVNPHCRPAKHGGPRRADSRWFCWQCIDHARANLTAAADAWPDLRDALTRPPAVHGEQGRQKRGQVSTGLVINEVASKAMAEIAHVAWFYAKLVADERGAAPPTDQTPALLRWLAKWHGDWLAEHEDQGIAEAWLDDAHGVKRTAHRAAYPTGVRKVEAGLPCQESGCEGTLFAWVRPQAYSLPDLQCSADREHVLEPAKWERARWKRGPWSAAGMTRLANETTSV